MISDNETKNQLTADNRQTVFEKVTVDDIPMLTQYFAHTDKRICDFTPGTAVMWRNFFDTQYALIEETLVFRVNYFGTVAYSFPVGKNIDTALEFILDMQNPATLCNVTDEDIAYLSEKYQLSDIDADPAWFDYLYDASEFLTYSGKKLSGQRNHVNRFNRDNPNWHTEIIDEKNAPDVISFFRNMEEEGKTDEDVPTAVADGKIVFDVLTNWDKYEQCGAILYSGEKIIAFSIGEKVGDTLFAHIEKADTSVSGSYQKIAQEFARAFADDTVKYINREEDTGDIGLRTSKESYHPIALLRKSTVTFRKK